MHWEAVVKMISTEMKSRTIMIIMIVVMKIWLGIMIHHNYDDYGGNEIRS